MTSKKLNFNQVIDALLDDDAPFPFAYLMSLSDILPANLEALKRSWGLISPARKTVLMENVEIIHEAELTSNFEGLAVLALDDVTAAVRVSGLRLFNEYENSHFISRFIDLLENDKDMNVRSQAASTLGKYLYLAEIDMIDEKYLQQINEALVKVLRSDENELVRQKALESLGFSSRMEAKEFIQIAYNSGDYNWIASSLIAMGRSAEEAYATLVLPMLAHPDARIQREAVFAAGELELTSTKKLLLRLAMESKSDDELWTEVIIALSKIGGDGVLEVFDKLLEDATSGEEEDFLNEAIENLGLTNDMSLEFDMMDLQDPEDESLIEVNLEDQEFDLDDYGKSWIDELEENLKAKIDLFSDEDDDYDDRDELNDDEDPDEDDLY